MHQDMATRQSRHQARVDAQGAGRQQKVLRRFRIVFNAVKSHFRSVETRAGISGAQLWALGVISGRPGIGVNDLAQAMDVHQSTASNLVRSLVDAGMVRSERESADRRVVQLTLTLKGSRALAKAPAPFAGVLPQALKRLDPDTLARLERDLSALLEVLGAGDDAKVPLGETPRAPGGISSRAGGARRSG